MRLIKRSLKVLPLALVAAALLAPTASAAPQSANCVLNGVTGDLTPPVKAILNGTGGSGTFTFEGGAVCSGVIGGTPLSSTSAHISASGTYTNQVCGTGTADGTATIDFNVNGVRASSNFHIDFRGGQGVLTLTYNVTAGGTGSGSGQGAISIVPSGGNCVNEDVSEFTVLGGFAATGND